MNWIWFELWGVVWWYFLVSLGFVIYWIGLSIRTYNAYEFADDTNKGWEYAIREALYPDQKYFRIWDIIRTPFMMPGYLLGFIFFLLKAGAWKFIPVLRRIFGIKLFRLEKEEKK